MTTPVESYCGEFNINTPIESVRVAVNDMLIKEYPGLLLTGIVSSPEVVYMSTSRGDIKKVL